MSADEFRKRAAYCETQATARGLSHSAKARILRLAARWNAMADDAEYVAAAINAAAIAAANKAKARE
jgi:hypothetical protein